MKNLVSRSLPRRTTAASAALLLGLSLVACGGDDGSDTDSSNPGAETSSSDSSSDGSTDGSTDGSSEETTGAPTEDGSGAVPTEEELASVLLTTADLPAGFSVQPDDGDDDSDDTFEGTCLADVGDFSDALGFEPDEDAEVSLAAETSQGQSAAQSKVEAYADAGPVAPAFAEFSDKLQSCTSVSTTDADGVTYDLAIAYDDTVDLPGADDQLRVQMTGTIAAGEESYDVVYRFVVALSGSFISIINTYAVGADTTGVLDMVDDLAATQLQRVDDTFA